MLQPKPESAVYIFVNTVDSLRKFSTHLDVKVPIVCDELDPSDGNQLVHSSPNLIKCLLSVDSAGGVRGRNDDIAVPACPVLLTSNSIHIDGWVFGSESDRIAMKRRLVWAEVTSSLLTDAARSNVRVHHQKPIRSVDDAVSELSTLLDK